MSPSIQTTRHISTTPAVLLAVALVVLFAQIGGRALTIDPLVYGGGILVTGDYVASGVDLTEAMNPPDVNGLSTGTIPISGVPADADILSANLIWETITFTADPSQAMAKFRGHDLDLNDVVTV